MQNVTRRAIQVQRCSKRWCVAPLVLRCAILRMTAWSSRTPQGIIVQVTSVSVCGDASLSEVRKVLGRFSTKARVPVLVKVGATESFLRHLRLSSSKNRDGVQPRGWGVDDRLQIPPWLLVAACGSCQWLTSSGSFRLCCACREILTSHILHPESTAYVTSQTG